MLARKDASDDDNDQKPGSVDLSWIQSHKKESDMESRVISCDSLQGILSVFDCASIESHQFLPWLSVFDPVEVFCRPCSC